MHPYLIDLGPVSLPLLGRIELALPTYGVLVALAILFGWFALQREARRGGLDPEGAANATFWAIVGGIVGGKLGLLIVEFPAFLADPKSIFSAEFLQAAGVVWMAVLCGLGALVISARRDGVPLLPLADAAGLPMPLCQAIGRLGCLMAGCCYGARCDLPWGIVFTSRDAHLRTGVPLGVALHPTALYEILWNLLVVFPALLWLRSRKERVPGELITAYLALYGIGRFGVEFFRGDKVRGLWLGGALSTSQLISLLIAPIALGVWLWLRRRGVPAAVAENPS